MPAMTPMKCFRINGFDILTEDMVGGFELICVTPTLDARDFILNALTRFHYNTPTLTSDNKALVPFTSTQVKSLMDYQRSGDHPYTCENSAHGELVPSQYGWTCQIITCPYKQNWAHARHTGVL